MHEEADKAAGARPNGPWRSIRIGSQVISEAALSPIAYHAMKPP